MPRISCELAQYAILLFANGRITLLGQGGLFIEKFFAFLLLFLPLLAFSQTNAERITNIQDLKRISFGSCNDQGDDQPLWDDLILQKPDLWIWTGDKIYADRMSGGPNIEKAYAIQNKHPRYHLFKQQTPIIGTWDDHDYAYDNAGGSSAGKKESQSLALDFLEIPKDSPLRTKEGIYQIYEFGSENRKIKIIILDNRYFKGLDSTYPMLGKVQWDWLEQELTNSTAKINFIVTGLSVLSPPIPYTEEWTETNELTHMLDLLKKTNPKGVIFLTGDKHFHSIFQRWGHLEFMSSGMTHVADRRTWFYLSRKYPRTYFGLSYGQIDLDWAAEDVPIVKMSMRTPKGTDIHTTKFTWAKTKWTSIP